MCPTCRQPAWKNDLVYNHRMANVVESVKCLAGVTCGPLKQGHGPASQPGDQSQGAEGGGRPTKRPRRSGRRAGSGKRGAPRLPDRGHPGAQARAGWVHGGSQGAAGVGGLAQPSEDSGVDAGGRGPGIDSSPAPAPAVIAASPAPAAAGPERPVVAAAIPPAALPRAVCGALACADADPGALPPEPGLEPGCLPDTSPGRSKARVCQACASQLDLDRVVLASQQDRASCAELSSPMPGESSGAAALGKPEAPARDQEAGGVKGLDLDSPSCAGGPGLDATPPGLATPPLRHEMLLLQRAILLCDVLGTLGPTAEALPGTEAERPALEEQADTAGASPADVSPGAGRSTEPGAPATGGDDAARPPCRPPTSQGTVDTTHVIVATDARGVVATRVMKLCQALAVGCWILAPAWLEACMEAGAWVPEQAFEGDGCCLGGPARARKRADRGCPGLFAGRTFRIVGKGPLHAAGLTKAIELAGGSIVTRSLPGACLVSLQNDLEFLSKAWVCGAGMARR
ncbi:BREAST CANCER SUSCEPTIBILITY 1-like protein [Auxenochlorella protothecoides]|uniref:BREAST CANCER SUSCEPTIBILITY 1-like protein n=1 Tax=Auxenochlorella protothecoides TaxID=3075 RepID=A0A087S9V5_AUXPR|nr:BREAST CANCER SUSCEPTIBILITY 1-like protein [Auxenochlorella protothecoides]KFM22509.1 BREAST CANCER SUSCEPTIBILITY 1-like protein [Auxenochlorella protothecoides]